MKQARILVAGIGNIFLGDDAFGVHVVQELARRTWPDGVRIVDFGIRGLDLAYALLDPYETVILVDALPRGDAPGTLHVLEPDLGACAGEEALAVEAHSMDPVKVLRLATAMGPIAPRILVVGCEPATAHDLNDMNMEMSGPVAAAVDKAAALVETLIGRLLRDEAIAVEETCVTSKEIETC